jgi:hypothetical protein
MEQSLFTPSSPSNDPTPDRPESHGCCSDEAIEARTAQQFATLAALTRIGLKVARVVERVADATEPAEPPATDPEPPPDGQMAADLALAYSRVARAVRANLTQETKITQEHRSRAERDGRETARRARLKGKVRRVVSQLIETEYDPDDHEEFHDNLEDCLDEFDNDPDFASRSVGEVVASVCTDLSLVPDWDLWQYEIWGAKEIRTRPPGSPFADWPPDEAKPDEAKPDASGHDPPGAGT